MLSIIAVFWIVPNADETDFYFPRTSLFQSTGLISVIGRVANSERKIKKKKEKKTGKIIDRTYVLTRTNARELLASHSQADVETTWVSLLFDYPLYTRTTMSTFVLCRNESRYSLYAGYTGIF